MRGSGGAEAVTGVVDAIMGIYPFGVFCLSRLLRFFEAYTAAVKHDRAFLLLCVFFKPTCCCTAVKQKKYRVRTHT